MRMLDSVESQFVGGPVDDSAPDTAVGPRGNPTMERVGKTEIAERESLKAKCHADSNMISGLVRGNRSILKGAAIECRSSFFYTSGLTIARTRFAGHSTVRLPTANAVAVVRDIDPVAVRRAIPECRSQRRERFLPAVGLASNNPLWSRFCWGRKR